MTSKKFLSDKKTAHLTISISPALRDWIQRYVNVMHKKFPNDENYRSLSTFCCEVLENVLEILEKGKTLEDFDKIVDTETSQIIDEFSFKAFIPVHEEAIKENRYTRINFDKMPRFYFKMHQFYKSKIDPLDTKTIKNIFNRMKAHFTSTKLLKLWNLDLYTQDNFKYPLATQEFQVLHKNLHYLNCKLIAFVYGLLGGEITDFIYSDTEFYARYNIKLTELFFDKELRELERKKLAEKNLDFLTNYYKIIYDEDFYLWMRLADDPDLFVNFNTSKSREKWLERIENDLKKYSDKKRFVQGLLKFFNKIHWITLINEQALEFIIQIQNESDRNFLLNYLSKYGNITENKERFHMEEYNN